VSYEEEDTYVSYEEEDTYVSYVEEDTYVSYEEEDTYVSYEEEDTYVSYEEEDTYVSYEEEDTYLSYEDHCVHVTTVSTSDSCPQTGGEGFVLASSVTLVQPQNCFSNYSSVTLALDDHRVPFMTIACHSSPVGIHLSRNRKCRRQRAAALGQVTHEPKCLLPGFPSHTHTHINTLGFALTHL